MSTIAVNFAEQAQPIQVVLQNTPGGTLDTAANIGSSGLGVFASKVENQFQFYKLRAGPNMTITLTGTNELLFSSSGSGEGGGGGDMFKAIYDQNNDGIVDLAASAAVALAVAWTGVTSRPTTLSGFGITDPVVLSSGSYSNPSWITALAWSKITGAPTTLSAFGITDPVVLTSGSYANPNWITSLDYSKLTNVPGSAGEANTAANVGTGSGLYKEKSGVELRFKSLTQGANITLTANANDVQIAVSGLATVATSGSYNDLSNRPTIPAAQVNADWTAVSGVAQILNKPTLATVATSGSYNDLSNKPTIPAAQVNSDWAASSGLAQILNKPTFAAVATSGAYADLSGRPTLATVATSGSYNDLTDKPATGSGDVSSTRAINTTHSLTGGGNLSADRTLSLVNDLASPGNSQYYGTNSSGVKGWFGLPVSEGGGEANTASNLGTGAQVYKEKSGVDLRFRTLVNGANIAITTNANDLSIAVTGLATVATSGAYNDLTGKPTIPAAQVNSDWNAVSGVAQILNKPTLATVATSGAYADLSGRPTLATVATSGLASDLTGTLAAARLPAMTGGDVTSSAGSASLTIGNATVTLAKMANLAANSILGNNTGSAATPIAMTVAQTKTLLAYVWNDIGSKPTTFAPSAHASSHASGGSDEITIAQSQVTSLVTDLSAKAALASPAFTGTPTAPTAPSGTNTTQVATTAFVTSAVAALTPAIATLTYASTTDVPFTAAPQRRALTLTGNITFTGSGYADFRQVVIFVTGDSVLRTVAFPSGWKFFGTKPTDLAANKVAVLSLQCLGSTEADVRAAWGVEA